MDLVDAFADCPTCGEVQAVDTPPGADDSAERACVACGTGLLLDPILLSPARVPAPRAA